MIFKNSILYYKNTTIIELIYMYLSCFKELIDNYFNLTIVVFL